MWLVALMRRRMEKNVALVRSPSSVHNPFMSLRGREEEAAGGGGGGCGRV